MTTNKPLTVAGLLLSGALIFFLAGLALDPRTVGGAPVWLKPAKFAISGALYCFTLAWYFRSLENYPHLRRIVGWITALVIVGEVAIIALQAARGVASHFNVSTPLDAALFGAMGIGILTAWIASIAILVALWRQPFADPAKGWSLRFGMAITVLGTGLGGVMTVPAPGQVQHGRSGSHTVGAPDGGPGLPGVGWSTEHGDLRVPHFFGMHALQILPLLGWLLARGRRAVQRVFATALSYLALFGILAWQALRGQSVAAPDLETGVVLACWVALSACAFLLPSAQPQRSAVPT